MRIKYKVIGIGGAGRNRVNAIDSEDFDFSRTVNIDTDIAAVSVFSGEFLQIGKETCRGLGSVEASVGLRAAIESESDIVSLLSDTELLILTAGLGGGCGTGALPFIVALAKDMGIKTVVIATAPAPFEPKRRKYIAENCKAELQGVLGDDLAVIPINAGTEKLSRVYEASDKDIAEKILEAIANGKTY